MEHLKVLLKKYKNKQCTVKEQMLVRMGIFLTSVLTLVVFDAIANLIVWIRPYLDSIIFIASVGLVAYEGLYLLWYVQLWAYGGVSLDTRRFYPYIQNAIFMVFTDIYTSLGVMKPSSKSAVSSIGQKTFVKGNWVIYQYNMLLLDSSDEIDVNDAKEILQNELIRKSEDGFDGISFDINGYPYLQVDSVLVDGSYLQVQMVILWNEAQKNTYEAEQEQKQGIHSNCVTVDDEVF